MCLLNCYLLRFTSSSFKNTTFQNRHRYLLPSILNVPFIVCNRFLDITQYTKNKKQNTIAWWVNTAPSALRIKNKPIFVIVIACIKNPFIQYLINIASNM